MSSESTVRKITGVATPRWRSSRSTSSPFIPGIRQSNRITSALSPDATCSSAAGPLAKLVTAKPSSIKFRLSDSRNSSSSSIRWTRTRDGICFMLGEEVGEALASGWLGSLMGFHLIVQRAHDLTLQVEVEVYLKLATPARVAPNGCGRRLGALAGLAEQGRGRGLVEADQVLRLELEGAARRRWLDLGDFLGRSRGRRDLRGRRGVAGWCGRHRRLTRRLRRLWRQCLRFRRWRCLPIGRGPGGMMACRKRDAQHAYSKDCTAFHAGLSPSVSRGLARFHPDARRMQSPLPKTRGKVSIA